MTYEQQVKQWHAAAKKSARQVLSSKRQMRSFLQRVGILDKSGKRLAKAYR